MRTNISKAKLILHLRSDKKTKRLETISIFDNRTQKNWEQSKIESFGLLNFLNLDDVKETASWHTNSDSDLTQIKFAENAKDYQHVIVYLFN